MRSHDWRPNPVVGLLRRHTVPLRPIIQNQSGLNHFHISGLWSEGPNHTTEKSISKYFDDTVSSLQLVHLLTASWLDSDFRIQRRGGNTQVSVARIIIVLTRPGGLLSTLFQSVTVFFGPKETTNAVAWPHQQAVALRRAYLL